MVGASKNSIKCMGVQSSSNILKGCVYYGTMWRTTGTIATNTCQVYT